MKNKPVSNFKMWILAAGAVFVLVAFTTGAVWAQFSKSDVFPAHFFIAGVDVSGRTSAEASRLLNDRFNKVLATGLVLHLGEKTCVVPLTTTGESVAQLELRATLDNAETWVWRWRSFLAEMTGAKVDLAQEIKLNPRAAVLLAAGNDVCLGEKTAPQDARFAVVGGELTVVPEQAGQGIAWEELLLQVASLLAENKNELTAQTKLIEPTVTTAQAEKLLVEAKEKLPKAGTIFVVDGNKATLSAGKLMGLLQPQNQAGEIKLGVDESALRAALANLAKQVEQPAHNAELTTTSTPEGVRVSHFVPGLEGVGIDWSQSSVATWDALVNANTTVTLTTTSTPPEIPTSAVNEWGIKDLLGVGKSNFAGSPVNRRHNIKTGANHLSGILIQADEEFSLVKALGTIDASTGYRQELVIKENKTIPEFGGGLCQIGTTVFRAALASGLPILERRNHSYQVSYYFEKGVSGVDATIYQPKPDLRFKNDTGNPILIYPLIRGDVIEFQFWGVADGRKASRTIPKNYNRVSPPPAKLIETTDLKPGEKKCTEKAHAGATASFTYSVEYPNGEVKKTDFTSVYKPWGEVCLLGVVPTSTPVLAAPDILNPDAAGVVGN